MPDDLGLAYVVIVHLAPDHESELAAILGRRTNMPVVEVTDQDLENFLVATDITMLFLDRRLCIKRYSAIATGTVDLVFRCGKSRRRLPATARRDRNCLRQAMTVMR